MGFVAWLGAGGSPRSPLASGGPLQPPQGWRLASEMAPRLESAWLPALGSTGAKTSLLRGCVPLAVFSRLRPRGFSSSLGKPRVVGCVSAAFPHPWVGGVLAIRGQR